MAQKTRHMHLNRGIVILSTLILQGKYEDCWDPIMLYITPDKVFFSHKNVLILLLLARLYEVQGELL